MDRPSTSQGRSTAFDKGLNLLDLIVSNNGETPLSELARQLDLPPSTARRLAGALERRRLIARVGRGLYSAGARLVELGRMTEKKDQLTRVARPPLRRLARTFRATAHLGVLEGDMVTYLVKQHTVDVAHFTRERQQLEAYCSGMGKVLLAALDEPALDAYFSSGDLVALTARTITEPSALRDELATVASRGFALDNGEVADGLFCIAAPVRDPRGVVAAAISISSHSNVLQGPELDRRLDALTRCATDISRGL